MKIARVNGSKECLYMGRVSNSFVYEKMLLRVRPLTTIEKNIELILVKKASDYQMIKKNIFRIHRIIIAKK